MKKRWIITALSAILIACSNGDYEQNDNNNGNGEQDSVFNFEEFLAEFQYRKTAWESLQIDHYRFIYEPPSRGVDGRPLWSPLLTITVSPDREPEIVEINGRPIAVATAEEIEALDDPRFKPVPTIASIFSQLDVQFQGTMHEAPFFASYEIVYNKDYHFPESFSVRVQPGWVGGLSPIGITAFEDLRGGFNFEEFWTEFQYRKAAWESLQIDHYRYMVLHSTTPSTYMLFTVTVYPDEREPEITGIRGLPIASEMVADSGWLAILDNLLEELHNTQRTPLTITQLYSYLEREITTQDDSGILPHESPYFERYEAVYNKNYHFPEYFFMRLLTGVAGGPLPTRVTSFEDLRER